MIEKKTQEAEIKLLKNGMQVVFEPLPYVKSAAFGVFITGGSSEETTQNNGISHVIEHMLFKGTEKRSAKQLADEMALLGDMINAYTGKEYTAYYGVTISENLSKMMELLSDMLFHSAFEEEALKKEKSVICEEIDLYNNSPEDLVHELLQMRVYRHNPIGFQISGRKGTVREMKREEILTYFREHYTPERIILSIAGAYEREKVEQDLENLFVAPGLQEFSCVHKSTPEAVAKRLQSEGMHPDSRYRRVYGEVEAPEGNRLLLQRKTAEYQRSFCSAKRDTSQIHMNMAFPAISYLDERRYAATVFHSIFGGSNNSLLFQRIREEKGLAYSVYSYGCPYAKEGLLHVDAVSTPGQAVQIFLMILSCCRELTESEISEETLQIHKSLIRTEEILSKESVLNRMEGNGRSLLLYGRVTSQEEKLAQIKKVSTADIKSFAEDILRPGRMSLCLVGEQGTEEKKLKSLFQKLRE